jgi:phage shock protein C
LARMKTGMKLLRRFERGKMGGVLAGIADYFGTDATVFRVLFGAWAVFSPASAGLFYILAWVMMPPKEKNPDRIIGFAGAVLIAEGLRRLAVWGLSSYWRFAWPVLLIIAGAAIVFLRARWR